MNYLVVLIFTLTALKFTTSLCIYSLPFDRLICFEKRSKLERVENRRGWAFYSEFLLCCHLSDFFFSCHFIRLAFTVCNHMQILKKGERGEGGGVGRVD